MHEARFRVMDLLGHLLMLCSDPLLREPLSFGHNHTELPPCHALALVEARAEARQSAQEA